MTRGPSGASSIDNRLLETAIDQFGRNGLEGASTRAIAAAAGTTMSSITYHYGSKQGLYLAAARHIADQMGERMAPALAESEARSRDGEGPDAALSAILAIIDRFVEMMVHPESAAWARFIVREQMEPTEAFDVLYSGVMGRLVDHLSALIVRIGEGRCDAAEARLKTVAIVGQALVFRVARATVLRVSGWTDIDTGGAATIRRIVRAHTVCDPHRHPGRPGAMTIDGDRAERPGTDVPVLIVGAGPTGLVLALWLTRLGVAVRIIDKTAEPGTTSRALAVSARTLELYRQMGMDGPLVEGGVKVPAANFWVQGTGVARLPLDRMGEGLTPFPFALIFPQDAHERVLVERLEALGVKVERRTTLIGFEPGRDGVRATLEREDGSREICRAAYLAGCDGAHSIVRETLAIGFPGGTYSDIFFVADVDGSGPATNGEIHVDLGRSDFLAVFPMKGPGRVRLVGTVIEASVVERGNATFEDVRDRVTGHLKFTIDRVNWFSTYHVHHRVAAKFREGRAFLLGDAAHVHSPVGGQGMNTGIGDAVNLSWKLAAVLNGGAAESLLDTYEPERIGFARRLVATTDRVFAFVTDRGPIAWRMRTRLVPLLARLLFRLDAMRRFLFLTVSQIGVNYRHSPLSEGAAGSVRGGDRLPWVQTGPDDDNFAPLTSMAWQVHVYGEPRPSWPMPASSSGCRSTRSPGRPRWNIPVSSAGRSTSFGRTDTSRWPTRTAIRSDWAAIS